MSSNKDPKIRKAYQQNYYYSNHEKALAYAKNYRETHKEQVKEAGKRWRLNNSKEVKESSRNRRLQREYGIDLAQYKTMLLEQNNRCAICKTDTNQNRRHPLFHVDHDHTTGLVRGLLCNLCNVMLGSARDSVTILAKAVMYLNEVKNGRNSTSKEEEGSSQKETQANETPVEEVSERRNGETPHRTE